MLADAEEDEGLVCGSQVQVDRSGVGHCTLRQLRQEGLSYGKIADRLNKDGHRTRTNKPWHAAQVWNVLRRARTLRSTSNPK